MSPHHSLAAACFAAGFVPFAAAAQDTIKIGFPMPLSGPAAVYGVPVTKGAELAVQEINAKGGVLGRKLELLERDERGLGRAGDGGVAASVGSGAPVPRDPPHLSGARRRRGRGRR